MCRFERFSHLSDVLFQTYVVPCVRVGGCPWGFYSYPCCVHHVVGISAVFREGKVDDHC